MEAGKGDAGLQHVDGGCPSPSTGAHSAPPVSVGERRVQPRDGAGGNEGNADRVQIWFGIVTGLIGRKQARDSAVVSQRGTIGGVCPASKGPASHGLERGQAPEARPAGIAIFGPDPPMGEPPSFQTLHGRVDSSSRKFPAKQSVAGE